jgi:hypothetical protein
VRQAKFRRAVEDEAAALDTTKKQVREAGTLGDRPLAVLTSGHPYDPDPLIPASVINPLTELWITFFQVQVANLSARGRQIVLSDSSHMIPYDEPDAVVSAIREVWTVTRGRDTRAHSSLLEQIPAFKSANSRNWRRRPDLNRGWRFCRQGPIV